MSLNCKICPNNGINEFACETCMMEYSFESENKKGDMQTIKFTTVNIDGIQITRNFNNFEEILQEWYSDNCDLPANDDCLISAEINGEKIMVETFEELINVLRNNN